MTTLGHVPSIPSLPFDVQLRECVDRPAGIAADWMTVDDSEGRPLTLAEWMRAVRGHTAKIFEAADQST